MRTNPFYDARLFLSGSTGEHAASGIGWFLTALYLALLVASIAIACVNWSQDGSQRNAEAMFGSSMRTTPNARP